MAKDREPKSVDSDDKTVLMDDIELAGTEVAQPDLSLPGGNTVSDATEVMPPEATMILDDDTTAVIGAAETEISPTVDKQQSSSARSLRRGDLIRGRFKIENELGRGGMGSVYCAVDLRKQEAMDANPRIAMKVLNPLLAAHSQSLIMLQREARKSQQLAHPNVVTVYDFDREDDLIYMTMEELVGESLSDVIKANPNGMPADEIRHLIDGMCQGLIYAHSQGIVHSDLKPGNVFLTSNNVVKLLDLGIARAIPDASGTDTVFDAGKLGGLTPSYASPEMFAGEEPTSGDDLYALGLIAYELATGNHPFGRRASKDLKPEDLKLAKPDALKRREWRAVLAALDVTSSKRIVDVAEFRKQFFGSPVRNFVLAAAAATIAISVGASLLFAPDPMAPEIPFAELPAEIQTEVSGYLSQAKEAQQFQDFNAALLYLDNAEGLHPKNREVRELADDLVSDILPGMNQLSEADRSQQLQLLLEHASLRRSPDLLASARALGVEPPPITNN